MKKSKRPSRQSEEYKRQMEIGKALAALLPQVKSQAQVAKELGMSRFAVQQAEALALYKLFTRAHELQKSGFMEKCSTLDEPVL